MHNAGLTISCSTGIKTESILTAGEIADRVATAAAVVNQEGVVHFLAYPGAAGYAAISDATGLVWDQTPTWTGAHTFGAGLTIPAGQGITMADDTWIGIGAALERIVFDAAGDVSVMGANFGVGLAAPAHRLDVYQDIDGYAAQFRNDGDNVNRRGIRIMFGEDAPAGTNYCLVGLDGDGGEDGGLRSVAGAFAVYNTSDRTLKDNIRDTKMLGCKTINKLRVRDFEYKKSPGFTHQGFVAQEVENVIPNAVAKSAESDMLSLSVTALIPMLTKAIQELDARLTQGGL